MRSDDATRAATPDQLVQRSIHAAVRLQQAVNNTAAGRARLDHEQRTELSLVTRTAQTATDAALAPLGARGSLHVQRGAIQVPDESGRTQAIQRVWTYGSEFREQLNGVARHLNVPWTAPQRSADNASAATLPANLTDTVAQWCALVSALDWRLGQYVTDCQEWSARLFKRRATAPQVSQDSWNDTFRLDLLRAHAERLAAAMVAGRTRQAKASAKLALVAAHAHARSVLAEHTAPVHRAVEDLDRVLDLPGAPWTDPRWAAPHVDGARSTLLRLGEFRLTDDTVVPALLNFPPTAGVAISADRARRKAAVPLTRAILLRAFAAAPSGSLHAKVIDPVGIGQSVADFRHLSDYDPRLMDAKTWISERDIEAVLAELTAHIEVVISKYLRGQFQSIDDYNRHAGEVAEPYRLLIIFDYPSGFSERAAQQLLSLIENGPRCGVYTVLHHSMTADSDDREQRVPLDRLTQSMQRVVLAEAGATLTLAEPIGRVPLRFVPDAAPPIEFDADGSPRTPYAQFLTRVGEATRDANAKPQAVSLDSLLPLLAGARSGVVRELRDGRAVSSTDPDSWWSASSAESTVAVLGRSGAQGVTSMHFSSIEIAGGGIMVGMPRSGKTTAQHAMILSLSMFYSPDELELYLIDAKHGVEFQIYDELPHARMVSVHSEREFSLSILTSLTREIADRAETMKTDGAAAANITEYRRKTGKAMPRVVAIVDEFHTLFQEPDRVGQKAFAAFSTIVRQGPAFGVHLVVASQTLSDMPAMDRQTLMLLPQRVAFKCNEFDAEIVLGDGHRAAKALSREGEGVFNPSSGREAENQPFQGLYIEPDEQRPSILRALRERADREGWIRRPRVFDGHSAATRPTYASAPTPKARLTIPLGEPFSLDAELAVSLRRSRGDNVLIVGDSAEQVAGDFVLRGVLHSALASARAAGRGVTVIDFAGEEEMQNVLTLERLADTTGAQYARARAVDEELRVVAENVELRHARRDYGSPARLVILFGLERAAALSPFDPDLFDEQLDDDERLGNGALLARILRDGPEVGVHAVLSADSGRTLERRLGRDLIDEFNYRVAGQLTDERDLPLVTGHHGSVDAIPAGQLLLGNHVKGSETRARGYDVMRPDAAEDGSIQKEAHGATQ